MKEIIPSSSRRGPPLISRLSQHWILASWSLCTSTSWLLCQIRAHFFSAKSNQYSYPIIFPLSHIERSFCRQQSSTCGELIRLRGIHITSTTANVKKNERQALLSPKSSHGFLCVLACTALFLFSLFCRSRVSLKRKFEIKRMLNFGAPKIIPSGHVILWASLLIPTKYVLNFSAFPRFG